MRLTAYFVRETFVFKYIALYCKIHITRQVSKLQPNTTTSIFTRHPINQPKIIGDIITSNIHRQYLNEHIGNIADVSATFLTLVYLTECSPTAVCCSALFGNMSPMVLIDETSGENFNACIDTFIDVPMPW